MTTPISAGGLNTFEKLVETISDYLGRSDLRDQIPDFITLVEKELERDIPLRDSEFVEEGKFTGIDEFIDLPRNLLELRHLRVNTVRPYSINIVGIDKLNDVRTNGLGLSNPSAACHIGNRLYLAPTPTDSTITYTITYRGSIAGLGPGRPSNKILDDAPDCLLYGALMHAAPFIGADHRIQVWGGFYEKAKMSYRQMEHRNRTGGGRLQIRPDVVVSDQHSFRGRR